MGPPRLARTPAGGIIQGAIPDPDPAMRNTFAALLVVVISLLPAACRPSESASPLLAQNELAARSLLASWERGEIERMGEYFWADATYDDFSNSIQHRGLTEIQAYLAQVHEWGSDVVVNVTAVHPSADGAVAEWVFSAVQTAPVEGTVDVGTGREVILNGVTILEIDGGLVRRAADYVDSLPFVLQLGGRVERPGGTVLELDGVG